MDVSHVSLAAAVGVQPRLAVAVCLAVAVAPSTGQQDLPHAHCQEAEGRRVLGLLCATVMAAVWFAPGGGARRRVLKGKELFKMCWFKHFIEVDGLTTAAVQELQAVNI